MKVLMLTNKEHHSFVHEYYRKYQEHNIWIFIDKVEEYPEDYDIGISFMYQYKVPAKQVNTHTWFNFHPAPLPEYKGRNLCYHAIMNGETEFGATLHYMDENFDTGDIIRVVRFPIHKKTTSEDLSKSAMWMSQELFKEYFPRILAGEQFERIPNVGGTYYKKQEIPDRTSFEPDQFLGKFVRAVTYKNFYPKVDIGGVTYKIVKE